MAESPTEKQILEALSVVEDPDLKRDIVSLGFVKDLKVCDGAVTFDLELTTPACPVKVRSATSAWRRWRSSTA